MTSARVAGGMVLASLIAAAALAPTAARAAALRCGVHLIKPGDAITAVEDECGAPRRRVAIVNEEGGRVGTGYYYDNGYGKATRKVIFRGGRVERVERLDD